MKTLAKNIKALRTAKGMTQAQLAKAADFKYDIYVSRYERDKVTDPPSSQLRALALALDTTMDELYAGDLQLDMPSMGEDLIRYEEPACV